MALFLFLFSLIPIAAASSLSSNLRVRSALKAVPSGFAFKESAADETVINLRFAIASRDIPGLHHTLYDISTPGNTDYGNWLTQDQVLTVLLSSIAIETSQVNSYLAPEQKSIDLVNAWLAEHNLTATPTSPASDWLSLDLTVKQANILLNANLTHFVHTQSGATVIRSLSYSSPVELEGHLEFVHPVALYVFIMFRLLNANAVPS